MKHQRTYAILMSILLVLSLFTPQIAAADKKIDFDFNTLEEDLQLEKQLEEESEHNVTKKKNKKQNFTDEKALPRLTDGIAEVEKANDDVPSNEKQNDLTLNGKVDKGITKALEDSDTVDVIIHMKDESDTVGLFHKANQLTNRTERIEMIQEQLKMDAETSQKKILQSLDALEQDGQVSHIQPLWIINGIAATITEKALTDIYQRDDVEKVMIDEIYEVPEITESETEPRLPEWGLEKIYATDVWGQYGIDGEGIVVGIMDTGVEMEHEALKDNYRGRDGNHASSWADFSSNGYATPSDGNGHGTHVAGTAVGGGDGEPIGVAPGAEWIAAKIFNDNGAATESGIHQAFQWFMAPDGDPANAPHVVNNSWGNSNTYNTAFYEGVQAWLAAGIFPLFAAGNDGPGSQTIGSPASFPESFAIGATDLNDQIAGFSSRGPVTWDGERYLKPQVAAPGVAIYSAWPGNGYRAINGTSMATPHVAGVIALLLQANPDMSIDEIKQTLMGTTRTEMHMGELPNDIHGHGIVNAYRAVTEAAYAGEVAGTITNESGQSIAARIMIEDENIDIAVPEDGNFQFKIREGTHQVIVESFGYITEEVELTVVKGETVEMNLQLKASSQFDISGTVTLGGEPVKYAYVKLQNTPLKSVRTNEKGEFKISGVPEDSYSLSVTGKAIASKKVEVQVNDNIEVAITVSESERIAAANWQTANNNNTRNAVSNEDIAVDRLEHIRTLETRGNIIFASPAVNDDTIVVTTDLGRVQAFDLETGESKWTFQTSSLNRSTPTITEDYVFVAGGQDRRMYALDIDSGVVLWQVTLDNIPTYETPIYEDGYLYLSATISGKTNVLALDAETGKVQWETAVGNGSYFGAALANDQLILGSYDGRELYALSQHDGSVNWTFRVNEQGFASHPVIMDDMVYAFSTDFGGNGTLWAIDASSGEEIWRTNGIGDTQAASPVIYDDIILVSSASSPALKGFDRHTGELLWENKAVNTAVNNGAAASNGIFFIVDSTGMLKAIDVFSGEMLGQWNAGSSSSSTPAIVSGQLIVATQTGLTVYSSPGALSGTIEDTEGNPVTGFARILGTDMVAEADENGKFELIALPGEYDVRVGKYGSGQIEEQLEFHSGLTYEKTYTLAEVTEGRLTGEITDKRSGSPIEGVTITVQDTPLETTTDEQGAFSFDTIFEGKYDLTLQASGYVETQITVEIIANETIAVSSEMDPVDVAVLNDYDGTVTNLLNQNNISAEETTWESILGEVDRYQVLYLNGAYRSGGWKPDKEDMDALLEEASINDVSIVFADTWGPNYGSINHLTDYYNEPEVFQDDSRDTNVTLHVEQSHPILGEAKKGERKAIINNGKAAWFNGFSGRNLATVESQRLGGVGTGVAYKAVTQNSAHLLLSTHAVASWNNPTQEWLQFQHQTLLNGVTYLIEDAKFGQFDGQIVDQNGNPLEARIEVLDTGVYVQANDDGEFNMFHDEGTFTLTARLNGYKTKEIEVTFKNGEVITETIEMTHSNDGQLSGFITNALSTNPISDVNVKLSNSAGEVVDETTTASNGYYEFNDLDAATYSIEFYHEDYVIEKKELEIAGQANLLDMELAPVPNVAVIGDRTSDDNLAFILGEVNIPLENYSTTVSFIEEIEQFDVVFFNNQTGLTEAALREFEQAADEHGVSIIYGDMFFSGGGITNLANLRGDPSTHERINIRSSSAQYEIQEENPIFGDREAGEQISILNPEGSRVTAFDGYSGFTLANIKHMENEAAHGTGVAYKPRTEDSMELLMSGHGIGIAKSGNDYTEAGLQMFRNAVIWTAYENFNVLSGTITDQNGNAIDAEITVEIDGVTMSDQTTTEDENFSIASIDGDVTVTVSSFGYESQNFNVTVNESLQPLHIELAERDDVGSIEGNVTNSLSIDSVENVHINIVGYPREATTNAQGYYHIGVLEPGTYEVEITKDEFLQENVTVTIEPGESKVLDINLRPSPTVGIIVDAQYPSAITLKEYLENRGYNTISMFYEDLELLDEVDLVFANSDYNNNLIPDEGTFKRFVEELDKTGTSVIWTGQHGGRGSIRYLIDYLGDPGIEYRGSGSNTSTVTLMEEHPIFDGVDDTFEFTHQSRYYYGFDNYSGTLLADIDNQGADEDGYMIGFKGRTVNSVEVLLGGMTIGHGFHPGDPNFDENREKIIMNSILWAIDNKESYAGEIRGQIRNEMDDVIQGKVTVEETSQTVTTDNQGNFFFGLQEGTYNLRIEAFGHVTDSFEVQVVNGEVLEESFVLQSDNTGKLAGEVRASSTGDLIEGANIEVLGTSAVTSTDENGRFELVLPEGEYDVRVTAPGYQPQTSNLVINEGETTELSISLNDSEAIALIASAANQNRLIPFLEENGYEVSGFNRNEHELVKEAINDFALVIFNESLTSINQTGFVELIEAADEAQVSMVFANQFGAGSINDLRDYLQNPGSTSTGFAPRTIEYEVLQEHPIFSGYNIGDTVTILDNGNSNQQYATFEDYSGTVLADLTHSERGRLGHGLAYEFRSSNHVQLLLGSLTANTYGDPGSRWTDEARTIYINALDWAMNASLGEIRGIVSDENGDPIQSANAVIEAENISVKTNDQGRYTIGVGTGEHVVSFHAIGYEPFQETVLIENVGDVVELNVTMVSSEQMTLHGQVIDQTTGEGLSEVNVTVNDDTKDLEWSATTDENGYYEISGLLEGEYDVTFTKEGFNSVSEQVTIETGQNAELNVAMSAFNIAVLGDFKGELSALLKEHGLAAEPVNWNVLDRVELYEVIIINSNDGSKEDMEELIAISDTYQTSLVFLDTWGVASGSIDLLEKALGHPTLDQQGYDEGAIFIHPTGLDHPIFAGFDEERIQVLAERSPYATFKDYQGSVIADLASGDKDKGASIGYDFRSEGHVHLLMSAFSVNNMIGPERGWTSDGKQLFTQAIEWAKDAETELVLPSPPEWKQENAELPRGQVVVSGRADSGVMVRILEGENQLTEVTADKNGIFAAELDLEEGSYELEAEAVNAAGTARTEYTMSLTVTPRAGHPVIPPKDPSVPLMPGR